MRHLFAYSCMIATTVFATACTPKAELPFCERVKTNSSSIANSGEVKSSGKAAIGGEYTLTNQKGEIVTHADFIGQPQMIYFGFAYCPDVCPMALQKVAAALDLLGDEGKNIQPIFITVDPERDTVESLAQYVTANSFPNELTGLTGTEEQIKQAMDAYKVFASKVIDPDYPEDYVMDHSSIIYVMDKQGEFVGLFTHYDTPEDIAIKSCDLLNL